MRARDEAAGFQVLDGVEHGEVHALDGAGNDVLAEVALVRVHANAIASGLLGGREVAEAAGAGNAEEDIGSTGDLRPAHRVALALIGEALRVPDAYLNAWVNLPGAGAVAGDVAHDGRD